MSAVMMRSRSCSGPSSAANRYDNSKNNDDSFEDNGSMLGQEIVLFDGLE